MSQLQIEQEEFSSTLRNVLENMLQPVIDIEILRRKECLTAFEVETLYNIPETTLRTKRCRGGGPAFRQGVERGSVVYTHEDIKFWLNNIKKRG